MKNNKRQRKHHGVLLLICLFFFGFLGVKYYAYNSDISTISLDISSKGSDLQYVVGFTLTAPPTQVNHTDTPKPKATRIKITPKPTQTKTSAPTRIATPSSTVFNTLKKGATGEAVKEVQAQLKKLGYSIGSVDGIFGSKTENAIKQFQENNGLVSSGYCTPETYTALFSKQAISKQPKVTKKATSKNNSLNTEYRQTVTSGTKYVLNTNTRKFHKPSCRHVKKIKPSNYKEYTGSREEVIAMGYAACKVCHP